MRSRRVWLHTVAGMLILVGARAAHSQEASRPDMIGEAESSPYDPPLAPPAAASAWPMPSVQSDEADVTAPTIQHEPPAKALAGGPILIEADIADVGGVAAVWLRYRATSAEGWVSRSMPLAGDGRYRIGIDPHPPEIHELQYLVGARDRAGNEAMAGSLGAPLRLELTVPATPAPVTAPAMTAHASGLLLIAAALLVLWLWARRAAANAAPPPHVTTYRDRMVSEQQFWKRLLAPLLGRSMDEQIDAIRLIAARRLHHPSQGLKSFSAPFLMDRLMELHQRELAGSAHKKPESRPVTVPAAGLKPHRSGTTPPVILKAKPKTGAEPFLDQAFAGRAASQITGALSRVHIDPRLAKPSDWLAHLREELGIDVRLLEHDAPRAADEEPVAGGSEASPRAKRER